MASEIDGVLKTQASEESTQSVTEVLRHLARRWSKNMASLSEAVSQATALRQAITAQQSAAGTQLWPGPVANPLARLHVIIIEKDEANNLENLRVRY